MKYACEARKSFMQSLFCKIRTLQTHPYILYCFIYRNNHLFISIFLGCFYLTVTKI